MGKLKTLISLLNDRRGLRQAVVGNFSYMKISRFVPDKMYLKMIYNVNFDKKLDLKNPKTFNEKLQWLKLYDKKPEYIIYVDKYEVKKYIADTIGEQYVIPTIEVWDSVEDINIDLLPEQFVLKCTHDSGSTVICRKKNEFDIESAKIKLKKKLKKNMFWMGRAWPYKNVKARIIAETYMEDEETSELRDYKFFCFNGKAKALFIATDRQTAGEETKFDFFDMEYNHLPITNGHPNAKVLPEKPKCFDEMRGLAEKLSAGIPHVRVDFYEVNGRVYFGELTFFHWSGLVPFEPEEWDYKFGDWIELPEKTT